jgi:hypothetical protein
MRGLPSVIARQLQNVGPNLRKNTYAVLRYTDPIEAQYYTLSSVDRLAAFGAQQT